MAKKLIEVKNVVKTFDNQVVLKGISLDIYENEFVTLLGPSGCGKTTLLRIIAGFIEPTEGHVIMDGEDIARIPAYKRDVNTVFQHYALFPHLDVYDNIAFGLKIKKQPKDIIDQKVRRMISLVGLEGFEHRDVTMMSGGQQQRVAIARALVNDPNDESMSLMLDYGVFYEFLPMDEFENEKPNIVPLEGVEVGRNYAMLISTACGLWRYEIGDTVRFTSTRPYKFLQVAPSISSMLSAKNLSWTMPKKVWKQLVKLLAHRFQSIRQHPFLWTPMPSVATNGSSSLRKSPTIFTNLNAS